MFPLDLDIAAGHYGTQECFEHSQLCPAKMFLNVCVHLPMALEAYVQTTMCTAMNRKKKCLSSLHITISLVLEKIFFIGHKIHSQKYSLHKLQACTVY